MYNPMPAALTPVSAWVNAACRLNDEGDLNGLMLHIENPTDFTPGEDAIVCLVDDFLRENGKCSVSTVANTIFPAALDQGDGIENLTERYLEVFERRMHRQGEWGRYFQRMVAWQKGKETVNQVAENIQTLKAMRTGESKFYGNVTEIAIFDPRRDLRKKLNRQCLSFIELKPKREGDRWVLHMMVVYRNHYYVQRTLGNLIGLGHLLRFIAEQSKFETGTLTVQSTHACLDADLGRVAVRGLIKKCLEQHPAIAA